MAASGCCSRRHHHLQRAVGIDQRTRNLVDDHFQERLDGVRSHGRVVRRETGAAAGEDVRKIECLVVGSQFHEQVEGFRQRFLRAGVETVDLVDDDDRLARIVMPRSRS